MKRLYLLSLFLTGCFNVPPNEAELWRCKPDELPKVTQYRSACEKSQSNMQKMAGLESTTQLGILNMWTKRWETINE